MVKGGGGGVGGGGGGTIGEEITCSLGTCLGAHS